jgi:hypothetical protein
VEIEAVACRQSHTLALTRDRRVFGWGSSGQLGRSKGDFTEPILLDIPGHPVFIAAGSHFSAMIMEDGALYMGGGNQDQEQGKKGTDMIIFLVRVEGLPPVVEVAGGWAHPVARTENGVVWSWGKSKYGKSRHGDEKISNIAPPAPLPLSPKE